MTSLRFTFIFFVSSPWLFFPVFLSWQTRDLNDQNVNGNSSIYRIFNKEMNDYNNFSRDSAAMVPVASTLPLWFKNTGYRQGDSLFITGISDPGLPGPVARRQATQRACALAALSQHTSGRYLSDYFLKNIHASSDSKYEEMYHFTSSSGNCANRVRIVRDTVLKSREVILLVAVPLLSRDTARDGILKFEGYLYNYEVEVDRHNRLLKKIMATISDQGMNGSEPDPDSLSFYQVNQCFTGVSNWQRRIVPAYDRFEYYYASESPENPDQERIEKIQGSSCKTGLWIAFMNQVCEQLGFFIKSNTVNIRSVNDQTQDTRVELNREKTMVTLNFTIAKVDLSDNKLTVQIKISNEN